MGVGREGGARECARGIWVFVTRINENRVGWTNEGKGIVWNKSLIKKKGGARLLYGLAISEVQ